MSLTDATKPIKTIPFTGKKSDFFLWSARFLAYCQCNGCKGVLVGTDIVPTTIAFNSLTEADGNYEEIKSLKAKNDLAMILLTMSVTDAISYSAIHNASNNEYIDGNAHFAWTNLNSIFKPTSSAHKHQLEQEFNRCALAQDDYNPDEWFATLEKIRLQLRVDFNLSYDDDKMISHILYNVKPRFYETIITVMKRDINRNSSSLSLEQVKEELRQTFGNNKIKNSTSNYSRNRNNDTVLVARQGFKKKVKTDCRICGKKGHKAVDCWNNPKNANKNPKSKYKQMNEAATVTTSNRTNDKSDDKKARYCTYCNKNGHTIDYCWAKKKSEKRSESADVSFDEYTESAYIHTIGHASLLSSSSSFGINKDTFIADTGASCHMRKDISGMHNLVKHQVPITVGNSETIYSEAKGYFTGFIKQNDGKMESFTLKDVLYVPDLWINLFSLSKPVRDKTASVYTLDGIFYVKFDNQQVIKFDKTVKSGSGHLFAKDFTPLDTRDRQIALQAIDYDKLHASLGHANVETTKATAIKHNLKFIGSPATCIHCAKSKQRQKNIPKENKHSALEIGWRISIDISSAMVPSFGNSKYWLLIQDDFSGYVWCFFLARKSDLSATIISWLYNFQKSINKPVRVIRMDGGGENITLMNQIRDHKTLQIQFEMTAPNTPQQNGKIERKFATLYGKVRAMLSASRLPSGYRNGLWSQAAKMATMLENIIVKHRHEKSPAELMYGNHPKWIKNIHLFGEVAMIADRTKIKSKLTNRGFPAIFIGYCDDHAENVFQFFNWKNKSILRSRDVIWLNKTYTEYMRLEGETITPNESEIDETNEKELDHEESDYVDVIPNESLTFNDSEAEVDYHKQVSDITQYSSDINAINTGEQMEIIRNDSSNDIDNNDEINNIVDDVSTLAPSKTRGLSRELKGLQSYLKPGRLEDALFLREDLDYRSKTSGPTRSRESISFGKKKNHSTNKTKYGAAHASKVISKETKNIDFSKAFYNGKTNTISNIIESKILKDSERCPTETSLITCDFDKFKHHESCFNIMLDDGNDIPKSYKDAKTHDDWNEWKKAMNIEFKNMEDKEVWEIKNIKILPPGRKLIGNRWVYAKKDDGRYRARTVAKGFSQVPGTDFQENFAPVINDTTFRIVLIARLLYSLTSGQFDVETAFLYGDLEEELWMILPEGYAEYYLEVHKKVIDSKNYCVKLKKAIYGLVQAARQWWKKFKASMAKLYFFPSIIDPCLFIKKKEGSTVAFVIIYVDDGGIIGTDEDIKDIINGLSKDFNIKSMGKMEHFVGCHIIDKENQTWIHQPKLLTSLRKGFKEYIKDIRTFKTPAAPKTVIMRPQEGDPTIAPDKQRKFRSGVGMLLYLVKHSRPDINNAVRELSKVADGATEAHWKALMRTIKFVLDTENYCLVLNPTVRQDGFYLEGLSDSEYAGDKETRISVFGYIIYFCGAPIAWKSKSGKSVTLSSTEAEYFAISEVAKEVIFAKQVIESIGIKISYPIIIKCDNVGAIYLSNNYTTSQRTKHIDIRCHFVREFIEDNILKVLFVPSAENDADILTKNTTEELHLKHSMKNIGILQS